MIVVTGAAGFIGSNIISELNKSGYNDIEAVDLDNKVAECLYLKDKGVKDVKFEDLESFIEDHHQLIQAVVHMGACSDTTETDPEIFEKYNVENSKMLWKQCVHFGLVYIYASSAATYGDGTHGYTDNPTHIKDLEPLNMYGQSKQDFDLWVKTQVKAPLFWAGLKFFNVYGPNENHKGRMASVVRHAYFQIKETGKMRLFRSHCPDVRDGEQTRDFVYVKDAARVVQYLMEERPANGIYNVGVGIGRTFKELVENTFKALEMPVDLEFIDTPVDIRDKYQYYTCADITRLRRIGFEQPMTTLEEGVEDYVKNYLCPSSFN
jgi:ADP-L-glycero-D-manno-heptose 6-epimerase